MSATNQSNGLPWSRGRGFRPKGPFQPARRPGESGGSGGDIRTSSGDSRPGSSNSFNNKVASTPPGNSNRNQGYNNHSNSNSTVNRQGSNLSNGYQDNRRNTSASSSYGNSGGSKDIRFAGSNNSSSSSSSSSPAATSNGRSNGPAKDQVQYNKQSSQGSGKSQGGLGDSSGTDKPVRVIAKYNYKANANSPLGEPELSLKQGQNLTLVGKHVDNDQWWHVGADDGSRGYAPASYLMLVDTKPSALPWLENKKLEELPQVKPVFKAYQSAYNKPTEEPAEEKAPSNQYYCAICDKRLNGPKPYGAHMASKAHKEEVELARENGTL